jgi:hypothetical protein
MKDLPSQGDHAPRSGVGNTTNRWTVWLQKVSKEFERFKRRRLWFLFGTLRSRGRARIPRVNRPSVEKMKSRYQEGPSASLPDEFVLYRIIGNDLVPRHAKGQSRANVEFILDHEPTFANCQKRWIVNRIADLAEEKAIIELLEKRNQAYFRIPFDWGAYSKTEWSLTGLPSMNFLFSETLFNMDPAAQVRFQNHIRSRKNLYAMNNNGARNAALSDGSRRAKWILPFDGNCFFTVDGFEALRRAVEAEPWTPYFIVPMVRLTDNLRILDRDFAPVADEEPQIAFRMDARERFDEDVPYGRRPKVDLLWRLVVPGVWDKFSFDLWDRDRPPPALEAKQYQTAGWVARLNSGRADLEVGPDSSINRGVERANAINRTLDELDGRVVELSLNPEELAFYDLKKIKDLARGDIPSFMELRAQADAALSRGPYSVVQKSTLPPSGDVHDYWHPAPYWWPDPARGEGHPYVRRDGERVPGTKLYDSESGRYDRTRLQRMFDDVTMLSLAGTAIGDDRYSLHAVALVRAWFVDPRTRMNPHLKYAQVRRGHDGDLGQSTGIIEFKDLYYFLDAVRLLAASGALDRHVRSTLMDWLREYVRWLESGPSGQRECRAANNHGTYYDLQIGSIAAFLGDGRLGALVCNRAKARISSQFSRDGAQIEELKRTKPRHYTAFGLAGWTSLARIVSAFGCDLWSFKDCEGRGLQKAMEWLMLADENNSWGRGQEHDFSAARLLPLWVDYQAHYGVLTNHCLRTDDALLPVMHPEYGIAPFWMLARR